MLEFMQSTVCNIVGSCVLVKKCERVYWNFLKQFEVIKLIVTCGLEGVIFVQYLALEGIIFKHVLKLITSLLMACANGF
jgi:hypothetical protein